MRLSKRVFEVVEERQHSAEWCAKIAARIEEVSDGSCDKTACA